MEKILSTIIQNKITLEKLNKILSKKFREKFISKNMNKIKIILFNKSNFILIIFILKIKLILFYNLNLII